MRIRRKMSGYSIAVMRIPYGRRPLYFVRFLWMGCTGYFENVVAGHPTDTLGPSDAVKAFELAAIQVRQPKKAA